MFVLAAVGMGCVSRREVRSRLGTPEENAADAVGHVTVSAPMFTPIETAVEGDRKLDFGKLREVDQLRAALLKPAFSYQRKEYSRLALALAARIAGAQLSSKQLVEDEAGDTKGDASDAGTTASRSVTRAGKDESEIKESETEESETSSSTDRTSKRTAKRTREVSRKTPDVPTPPEFPEVPDDVMKELVKLLADADPAASLSLPPDEIASLIASARSFMINLEEYHNVEGYDFVRGLEQDYVPYKMHFSVTAEPGWYARWYDYDAVAEVRLDVADIAPGDRRRPAIIILGASPAETGQTTSDFVAALDQLSVALDVAGSSGYFSAAGKGEYTKAVAERLMSLRSERTLTVGFPDTASMRIRFQSARIADRTHRRDLQPTTRMLTATVLVRRELRIADARTNVSAPRAVIAGLERRPGALHDLASKQQAWRAAHAELQDQLKPKAALKSGFLPPFFDSALVADGTGTGPASENSFASALDALVFRTTRLRLDAAFAEGPEAYERALTDLDSELAANLLDVTRSIAGPGAPDRNRIMLSDPAREALCTECGNGESKKTLKNGLASQLKPARDAALSSATDVRRARAHAEPRSNVAIGGLDATAQVKSYFAPSVWNEKGNWAPVRDLLVTTSRPSERLRADECVQVKTWIPPWLGETRRRLEVISATGYYRVPLGALDDQQANALEAREHRDAKLKELDEAKSKLAAAKAAKKAAEAELGALEAELKSVQVAMAGAFGDAERRAAEARALQLGGTPRLVGAIERTLEAAEAASRRAVALKSLIQLLEQEFERLELVAVKSSSPEAVAAARARQAKILTKQTHLPDAGELPTARADHTAALAEETRIRAEHDSLRQRLAMVKALEIGAPTEAARADARAERLQLESVPEGPGEIADAAAAVAAATADAATKEAAVKALLPQLDAADREVRSAQVASIRARASVLRRGRVVVRFALRGPSTVLCPDGVLRPAQMRVRLVGLDDCMKADVPGCSAEVRQLVVPESEPGRYDGVFDLAGVDLSFAVPPEVGSLDDARSLLPVRVVLQAQVLRDACPDCAGDATQSGAEQSVTYDVQLRPWSDAPPGK